MNETLLALSKVQDELNAPKSKFNSFGKYKYRKAEDIIEAVKPILKKHGAIIVISDNLKYIGGRHYVEATVKFYLCEKSDVFIPVTSYAREEEIKKGMDQSQITGASSSYARKYALNALFCIDDVDDSDVTNNDSKHDSRPSNTKIIDNPREYVFKNGALIGQKLCEVKDIATLENVLNTYGATMPDTLRNAISEHINVLSQVNNTSLGGF